MTPVHRKAFFAEFIPSDFDPRLQKSTKIAHNFVIAEKSTKQRRILF